MRILYEIKMRDNPHGTKRKGRIVKILMNKEEEKRRKDQPQGI